MFGYYVRIALLRCQKSPAMVALVVVTMAVGIAACMTAATVARALGGEPIPGVTDHLYVVTMDSRTEIRKDASRYTKPDSLLSWRDAAALVNANKAANQVALAKTLQQVATPDGTLSSTIFGLLAYGPVLQQLNVTLLYGRPWTQGELASHAPVAIIGRPLAEKLFGVSDAVGRSIEIRGHRFRVIGVSARWKPRTAFLDLTADSGQLLGLDAQLFVPVGAALDAGVGPLFTGKCNHVGDSMLFGAASGSDCRWLETWVALYSQAELSAYQRFLVDYAGAQHASGRFVYAPHPQLYRTRAWMTLQHVVPGDVGLNLLLASAFLVLCVVNVTGLLTARFLRRRVDVAIRRALGAPRWHVFVQHLVESGLLGLVGGALALPLTWFGLWIVRVQPVAYAPAAQFGSGVFVMLFVFALGVGMTVGILPAWRVCRLSPAAQIRRTV